MLKQKKKRNSCLQGKEKLRSDYREEQVKGKEKVISELKEKKGQCWKCGQKGHVKKECFQENKNNKSREKSVKRDEETKAQSSASVGSVFMVSEVSARVSEENSEKWICDTGCNSHMSSRKEWFQDLKMLEPGNVKMVNSTTSQVKGIGSVRILNEDGTTVLLTNVMYVLDMSRNLISLGTLENKGCWIKSKNGILKVIKGCITLIKAERIDALYMLKGKAVTAGLKAVQRPQDETNMEHIKLAHTSQMSLKNLVKKGCIIKQRISEEEVCEDFAHEEVQKIKCDFEKNVTEEKLEHSKLWSSASTPRHKGETSRIKGVTAKEIKKMSCEPVMLESWTGDVDMAVNLKNSISSSRSSFEVSRDKETSSASNCRKLITCQDKKFQRDIIHVCCQEQKCERRTCVSEKRIFSLQGKNEFVFHELAIQGGANSIENSSKHSSLNSYQVKSVFTRSRNEAKLEDGTYHGSNNHQVRVKSFGVIMYVPSSQREPNPREKKSYSDGEMVFKIWLPVEGDCFISKTAEFQEGKLIKEFNVKQKDSENQTKPVRVSLKSLQANETSSFQVQGGAYQARYSFISQWQGYSKKLLQGRDAASEYSEEENVETDLQDYLLTRSNVKRRVQQNKKNRESSLVGTVQFMAEDSEKPEPTNFEEKKRDPNCERKEEIQLLHKSDSWDVVDKLRNQKLVRCKEIWSRELSISSIERPSSCVKLEKRSCSQTTQIDHIHGVYKLVKNTMKYKHGDNDVSSSTRRVGFLKKSVCGLKNDSRL